MLYIWLLPGYLAVNGYFFYEIYKSIDAIAKLMKSEHRKKVILFIKAIFTALYSVCAFALLLAFAISDELAKNSDFLWKLRRVLKLIGNYHEGVLIYLMLVLAATLIFHGLYRIVFLFLKRKPKAIPIRRAITTVVFFAFVTTMSIYGVINARDIQVKKYEVSINKQTEKLDGLRIVMVSDLHLGYNIGVDHMRKMVELINEAEPDIVLIAGDFFDNEFIALDDVGGLINVLSSISSKYGVYAVYGNHDVEEPILGGFTFKSAKKESSEEMDAFVEACGIKLLRDEYIILENEIYIYGRPDYRRPGKGIEERKSAEAVAETMDLSSPIIVVDHEPIELHTAADAGFDLLLCGHTHDGQIFPLNLTSRYFTWENSCGELKIGAMTNIVSAGVGLFGPNMRVGTKADICVIDVTFGD